MLKNLVRSTLFSTCALAGALVASTASAGPTVEMITNQGRIVIALDVDKAPVSVANFLQYAKDGFYDGTIFHRVIPGFMIQGGGFSERMEQKPTRNTIVNEAKNGLKNVRGSLAMARRGDPDSASSQFFINHVDNAGLDAPNPDGHGYAVFGKVTDGLDVVDKIAKTPTANRGMFQNVPVTPVIIQSVKIVADKAGK